MSEEELAKTLAHLTLLRDRALENHAEFKASGTHITAAYFEGKATAFTAAIDAINLIE